MTHSLRNDKVKTRKPHLCFSCHRRFPIGTIMEYWACIYEGDFCSGYTCETCQEVMKLDKDSSDGFPDGYVNDWLDKNETPEQFLLKIKTKRDNCNSNGVK